MRSRVGFILNRMQVNIAGKGVGVTLRWTTFSGGRKDAGTGAIINGTPTPQTLGPIQALMHAAEAKSVLRQFVEIEAGDIILDFPPDAPLDGKDNLRFVVNGQDYEQKKLGGKLAKMWDMNIAGNLGCRTVLLELAT